MAHERNLPLISALATRAGLTLTQPELEALAGLHAATFATLAPLDAEALKRVEPPLRPTPGPALEQRGR